ncbi:MAG: hypothetical protein EBZ69_07685, partial [Alphaproteobacteria bacterium]|nr:hypothetical protein [Alphaproteobacteria bacterium]
MRILCFLMIMLACLPLRAETITLVADEWCPFTCDPASDPHKPGFLIDIVKAVFEKKGHVVTYRLLPWTRAINDTREGKYAALVGASQADGPDFIFHRTPLSTMQNAFFVKKDNPWRYTGLE